MKLRKNGFEYRAKINGARKLENCTKINGMKIYRAKIWVIENRWCAKIKMSKVHR